MAAHTKLAAVDRMLNGTNWAGALPAKLLAGEVDVLIARLYNKAEKAMTKDSGDESAEKPENAPAEIADAADAPPARPSEPELAQVDKIQRCVHGLPADRACGLCGLGYWKPSE